MNKKMLFCTIFLAFYSLLSQDISRENAGGEVVQKQMITIVFDRDAAITFLKEGLEVVTQNLSLTRSRLVLMEQDKGFYQMQPAGFEFWEQDQSFLDMKQRFHSLLEDIMAALKKGDESSGEYQKAVQGVFDTITFLISHVRWNICEIQYDVYRSTVGYYQKADQEMVRQYAINHVDHDTVAYSPYYKGKFSLLHPMNASLAPLVHFVQYEELSRCHQLHHTLRAYVTHYYRIFGESEYTTTFLRNLIKTVEDQFQDHMKRFTLDHILRFNGNADLGRLLY